MKYVKTAVVLFTAALLLNGCALLPAEEEFRKVPVFVNYEAEEYTYVTVQQGDLQTKKMIASVCVPAQEESYCFGISRIAYGAVNVQVGDTVQTGELLAELDMEDIEENLRQYKTELHLADARIGYLNSLQEVNTELIKLHKGDSEESFYTTAADEYRLELLQLDNTVSLLKLKLEELTEQCEKRRIYAEMDGVVTYLADYKEGDVSNRRETFVTVSDSTMAFVAETTEWMYLPEGEEVAMTINGSAYTGIVTGMTEGWDGKMNVSVELIPGSAESFPQGTRATLTVITAERRNVLYLPKMVVTSAGDESIVYVEEDGVRRVRTVVTGFESDSKIEIMSGLKLGDLVIKE